MFEGARYKCKGAQPQVTRQTGWNPPPTSEPPREGKGPTFDANATRVTTQDPSQTSDLLQTGEYGPLAPGVSVTGWFNGRTEVKRQAPENGVGGFFVDAKKPRAPSMCPVRDCFKRLVGTGRC